MAIVPVNEICVECGKQVYKHDEWIATVDEEEKRIIAVFHKKCYEEVFPREIGLSRTFKKPIKKGGLK